MTLCSKSSDGSPSYFIQSKRYFYNGLKFTISSGPPLLWHRFLPPLFLPVQQSQSSLRLPPEAFAVFLLPGKPCSSPSYVTHLLTFFKTYLDFSIACITFLIYCIIYLIFLCTVHCLPLPMRTVSFTETCQTHHELNKYLLSECFFFPHIFSLLCLYVHKISLEAA